MKWRFKSIGIERALVPSLVRFFDVASFHYVVFWWAPVAIIYSSSPSDQLCLDRTAKRYEDRAVVCIQLDDRRQWAVEETFLCISIGEFDRRSTNNRRYQ